MERQNLKIHHRVNGIEDSSKECSLLFDGGQFKRQRPASGARAALARVALHSAVRPRLSQHTAIFNDNFGRVLGVARCPTIRGVVKHARRFTFLRGKSLPSGLEIYVFLKHEEVDVADHKLLSLAFLVGVSDRVTNGHNWR